VFLQSLRVSAPIPVAALQRRHPVSPRSVIRRDAGDRYSTPKFGLRDPRQKKHGAFFVPRSQRMQALTAATVQADSLHT
jgi:hypothetical protein